MKKNNFSKSEKESIGTRIRAIRLSLNKNMAEFGELINPEKPVAQSIVSRWERGISVPNKERLNKITELGNVTMAYLLDGQYMAKDIHMMPEEEQRKLFDSQIKQMRDTQQKLIDSTKSNVDEIDIDNLSIPQLYLFNHFTRFLKNYSNIDDGEFVTNMLIIFMQLNKLYEEFTNPNETKERKQHAIDFYTNDLLNESSEIYSKLADFLHSSLD
ncbi:helix-turn-helix domain-containing protein [Enterococcus faecium]|uniref:helix-turn-helix domain-containing protein n=1 Tax=Enterococcus faecium TaxID=1352 RepID=UPI000CF35C51|nr:helix-turn-helix transcriptional regulator [Enterococcus faecium]PQG51387.1 hypothetical protein CUS15_10920 [Enterococcus faecium]